MSHATTHAITNTGSSFSGTFLKFRCQFVVTFLWKFFLELFHNTENIFDTQIWIRKEIEFVLKCFLLTGTVNWTSWGWYRMVCVASSRGWCFRFPVHIYRPDNASRFKKLGKARQKQSKFEETQKNQKTVTKVCFSSIIPVHLHKMNLQRQACRQRNIHWLHQSRKVERKHVRPWSKRTFHGRVCTGHLESTEFRAVGGPKLHLHVVRCVSNWQYHHWWKIVSIYK